MTIETTASTLPWYLLQVKSNYENKVADKLRAAVIDHGFEKFVPQILVPTESVKDVKDGRTKMIERRLYPSYVMVQMDVSNENVWHMMKKTPNVSGFLGGVRPTAMKTSEVDHIFNLMKTSEIAPKQKLEFEPGQVVRVKDGPFTDFNGSIESVDYVKSRLKVSVTIFGRATSVDLSVSDVEKI